MDIKWGKRPPVRDRRTLQFGKYLMPALPAPPPACDYTRPIARWTAMGNIEAGDCSVAAAGHMVQVWTANAVGAHKATVLTREQIVGVYSKLTGYNPKAKAKKDRHDDGVAMLHMLRYWRKRGLLRHRGKRQHRIHAFAKLDLKNRAHVKLTIDLFGACYIGVALPLFISESPSTNVSWNATRKRLRKADARVDRGSGHTIPAFAYDARGLRIVTWGKAKTMSWAVYERYADEAYAVLSHDWRIPGRATTPAGFDFAALEQDLKALRRKRKRRRKPGRA
jgi:hypothetical protein